MASIKLDGVTDAILNDIHIEGGDVGIEVSNSDFTATNVTFDNVRQPWLVDQSTSDVQGTRIRNDPRRKKGASTGWTKPNGPSLPAFCSNCKSIFPSKNYNFAGAYFNAWDNEEVCPKCGNEHAKLSEGLFDLTKETIIVLSAPDITHAMILSLQNISDDVVKGRKSADHGAEELDQVNPHIGALFRKAISKGMTAVMFVSTVGGAIYTKAAYDLGKEQISIGKQQVRLATASSKAPDDALAWAFQATQGHLFTSPGLSQDRRNKAAGQPSAGPTQSKAAPEPHAAKLEPKREPESRDLREKNDRDRRRAFGRARHGGPTSCN